MADRSCQPETYTNRFETTDPVAELAPGDRMTTETVDAHGLDRSMNKRASKDNPLTGPFAVRGAEPGDVLAVHLERLLPNRRLGWSSCTIAPGVVDPEYCRELPAKVYGIWMLEPETGIMRFIREIDLPEHAAGWEHGQLAAGSGPGVSRGPGQGSKHDGGPGCIETGPQLLPDLPVQPMLGCLGLAPPFGQSIYSWTSGPWGGNMDYLGVNQGTTVYFQVFASGGLLFMGDGHAGQSDGELSGTGVEISMDVTFKVDLIKARSCAWPRGENHDFIFTIGNARPLDQAARHAATEMLRLLQDAYGLSMDQACLLTGQAARFDVGNVFDPAYTMVCRLPKSLLPPGRPV
jgi:acetamidase/formamidase